MKRVHPTPYKGQQEDMRVCSLHLVIIRLKCTRIIIIKQGSGGCLFWWRARGIVSWHSEQLIETIENNEFEWHRWYSLFCAQQQQHRCCLASRIQHVNLMFTHGASLM